MKMPLSKIKEQFPGHVWGRLIDRIPGLTFTAENKHGESFTISVTQTSEIDVIPRQKEIDDFCR